VPFAVLVDVDAELVGSFDESRIVLQSRELLTSDSEVQLQSLFDQFNEALRALGLETRLVLLERSNSIVLYFSCLTLEVLMNLRAQWSSRQLRAIVESLFTLLYGSTETVRVRKLSWPQTEYERCLQFFAFAEG